MKNRSKKKTIQAAAFMMAFMIAAQTPMTAVWPMGAAKVMASEEDGKESDDSSDQDKKESGEDGSESKKEDTSSQSSEKKSEDSQEKKSDSGSSDSADSKSDSSGDDSKEVSGGSEGGQEKTDAGDSSPDETDTDKTDSGDTGSEDTKDDGSSNEKKADAGKTAVVDTKNNVDKDKVVSDELKKYIDDKLKKQKNKEDDEEEEDEADGGVSNGYLISHQNIEDLPSFDVDFRFWTVPRVYGFAKEELSIYEERDSKSKAVGKLSENGLLYVLKEVDDDWYYVESGRVRGFVKKDRIYTGDEAKHILLAYQKSLLSLDEAVDQEETSIENVAPTARALVDWQDNDAFTYLRATAGQSVVSKTYALAKENRVNIREEADEKGRVVGRMSKDALCYVIADRDKEWVYVESGSVRGFVKKDELKIESKKNKLRKKIKKAGEDSYKTADQKVKPEDNKALYYTMTSVKSGVQSTNCRAELLKYAASFIGNPYVWGGTSLTHGCDCSGFAQAIYKKFGYQLPRTSRYQAHAGRKIAVSDAQPGDLIFYASGGRVYHVVIYAGDGRTIEAACRRLGITSRSVSTKHAVWAVHMISDEGTDIRETDRDEVNADSEDYGQSLGAFNVKYYCPCEECNKTAGTPSETTTALVEGHTIALSSSVAEEGSQVILSGHTYTVTNSKADVANNEAYIYVSSHDEVEQASSVSARIYEVKQEEADENEKED